MVHVTVAVAVLMVIYRSAWETAIVVDLVIIHCIRVKMKTTIRVYPWALLYILLDSSSMNRSSIERQKKKHEIYTSCIPYD